MTMNLIVTFSVLALLAVTFAQDFGRPEDNWTKNVYEADTRGGYSDGENCHIWTYNFKEKGAWLGRGHTCVVDLKGSASPSKTSKNYGERIQAGLLDESIQIRQDAGAEMFYHSFNWRNFLNMTIECGWPKGKEGAKCDISANIFGLVDFKGNCTESDACAFTGELFPLGQLDFTCALKKDHPCIFKLKFYLDPHNPIILNINQIGNDPDTINKLRDFWVEPEENPKDNSSSQSFASAVLRMAFRIYTKATNFYFGMMYKDLKRMLHLPNVAPPLKPTGPPGLYGEE